MRAFGIIAASAAWAALIVWWWLTDLPVPLAVACLVAAALIAFGSLSWWPMLVPVGLCAAVVGASAISPTDAATCACEPVGWGVLLVLGTCAIAVVGSCYLAGWLLRQLLDGDRDDDGNRRLRLL